MANAVTGGDVKKLNKMMEKGELDPNKHLPLLFDQLRAESEPFLDEYLRSQRFKSGYAKKKAEDWVKKFLAGGAEEGITSVFDAFGASIESSIPFAETLGDIFNRMSHALSAMILIPKEFGEWWRGVDTDQNFMTILFGKSDESEFVSAVKYSFTQISEAIRVSMESSGSSIKGIINLMEILSSVMVPVIRFMGDIFEIHSAYETGGLSGAQHATRRVEARKQARKQAAQDFTNQGDTGTFSDIENRADVIMSDWDASNPAPGSIDSNTPWWQKTPGRMGADLGAEHHQIAQEVIKQHGFFNPIAFIRGISGEPIGGNNIPSNSLSSAPILSSFGGMPDGGDTSQIPSNIPYFNPGMSAPGALGVIEHRISLEITGTMNVDGSVSATVDDATFTESIKDTLKTVAEDAITDHYRGAIPQFHNVVQ